VPRDLPTESDALRNGVSTPMPDKSASDGVNILTLATVLGFVAFLATYAATRQSIAVVVAVAVFSLVLFGSTAVLFALMAVERARRSREEGMVAAMLGAMGVGREEVAGADKDRSRRSADEALSEALRRVRRESSRGRS